MCGRHPVQVWRGSDYSGEFDRFDCRTHRFFYYSGKSSKEV